MNATEISEATSAAGAVMPQIGNFVSGNIAVAFDFAGVVLIVGIVVMLVWALYYAVGIRPQGK